MIFISLPKWNKTIFSSIEDKELSKLSPKRTKQETIFTS